MAPGPTPAASSGVLPRGDLAGRRRSPFRLRLCSCDDRGELGSGLSASGTNGAMESGDGWVHCARGHRHWGRFGACGLFLADRTGATVVLQHRASGTHEGGTWSVPGGARDSNENYVTAALREAKEEAGIAASSVAPLGWHRADHGGWSYTTILARAVGDVRPRAVNWESEQVRWVPISRVDELPLHPGFAASWPQLRRRCQPLTVLVDTAYLLDADDHLDQLRADAAMIATAGLAPHVVPAPAGPAGKGPTGMGPTGMGPTGIETAPISRPPSASAGIDRWLPHIVLIVAAAPAALEAVSAEEAAWPQRQISIVRASGSVAAVVEAQARETATPPVVVAGTTPPGVIVHLRDAGWWNDQVSAARAWRPAESGV